MEYKNGDWEIQKYEKMRHTCSIWYAIQYRMNVKIICTIINLNKNFVYHQKNIPYIF